MFKQFVTQKVRGLLERFVDVKQDLNIFSPSGIKLQLKDLQLKTDALDALDLPIRIKSGFVGKLEVAFPIFTMGISSRSTVAVDGLYLVVAPISMEGQKFDHATYVEKGRATKEKVMQKMEIAEQAVRSTEQEDAERAAEARASGVKEEDDDVMSFLKSLLLQLLLNLEVDVTNVHIRFDMVDDLPKSTGHQGSVAGVTLSELRLRDDNGRSRRNAKQDTHSGVHRRELSLRSLAAYWDYVGLERSRVHESTKRLSYSPKHMQDLIGRDDGGNTPDADLHKYLLRPVDATARIKLSLDFINRIGGIKKESKRVDAPPDVAVKLEFPSVSAKIYRWNLLELAAMIGHFNSFESRMRYRGGGKIKLPGARPCRDHPEAARLWWRYAFKCVKYDNRRVLSPLRNVIRIRADRRLMLLLMKSSQSVLVSPWRPPLAAIQRNPLAHLAYLSKHGYGAGARCCTEPESGRVAAWTDGDGDAKLLATYEGYQKSLIDLLIALTDNFDEEYCALWAKDALLALSVEAYHAEQAFGGRHAYERRLEPLSPGGWIFGGGSCSSELRDNSRVSGRSLGRLVGHIRGGRGLRRTDDVEGHESRNKVSLSRSDQWVKSKTIGGTSPEWDLHFNLDVIDDAQILHFIVFHVDLFMRASVVGELMVPVGSIRDFPDNYDDFQWPHNLTPPQDAHIRDAHHELIQLYCSGSLNMKLRVEPNASMLAESSTTSGNTLSEKSKSAELGSMAAAKTSLRRSQAIALPAADTSARIISANTPQAAHVVMPKDINPLIKACERLAVSGACDVKDGPKLLLTAAAARRDPTLASKPTVFVLPERHTECPTCMSIIRLYQAVYNQAWESGSKIRGGRSDASLAEQIQFRLSANLPRVSANLTLDRGLTAEGSEAPSAKRGGYGDEQKTVDLLDGQLDDVTAAATIFRDGTIHLVGSIRDGQLNGGGLRFRRTGYTPPAVVHGRRARAPRAIDIPAAGSRRTQQPGARKPRAEPRAPTSRADVERHQRHMVAEVRVRQPELGLKTDRLRQRQINFMKLHPEEVATWTAPRMLRTHTRPGRGPDSLALDALELADFDEEGRGGELGQHVLGMGVAERRFFEEHFFAMQKGLYASSRYAEHKPHMADHERGRDRRAHDGPPDMDDVVSASLLVVEFTVQAEAVNDSRVTDPRARLKAAAGAGAAASLKGPQSYKRLGGTVHLSSVEALVHVPYLLSLIPFFGSSFDSIGGQPDTTPLYHTEGSITFVMQQVEITVINNQLGPNMPLLRVRAVDGYVVASEARGHRFQLDVQLPIETKSYNVDMHDYEVFIEPAVVEARLALVLKSGRQKKPVVCVAAGCSDLFINLTHQILKNAVECIPPTVKIIEDLVERRVMDEEFIRSPYWMCNHTGDALTVTGDALTLRPGMRAMHLPTDGSERTLPVLSATDEGRARSRAERGHASARSAGGLARQTLVHPKVCNVRSVTWKGEISGVRFDHVGQQVHLVDLPLPEKPFHRAKVSSKVTVRDGGSNMLLLGSLFCIRNETDLDLVLRMLAIDPETKKVLPPHDFDENPRDVAVGAARGASATTVYVPLRLSHLEDFAIRPAVTSDARKGTLHGSASSGGKSAMHGWSETTNLDGVDEGDAPCECPFRASDLGKALPTREERRAAAEELPLHFSLSLETEPSCSTAGDVSSMPASRAFEEGLIKVTLVISAPFVLSNCLVGPMRYTLVEVPDPARTEAGRAAAESSILNLSVVATEGLDAAKRGRDKLITFEGMLGRGKEAKLHCFRPGAAVEITVLIVDHSTLKSPVIPGAVGADASEEEKARLRRRQARRTKTARNLADAWSRLDALLSPLNLSAYASTNCMPIKLIDPRGRPFVVYVHHEQLDGGARHVDVFAQFWLVNKTGLPMNYRRLVSGLSPARSKRVAADVDVDAMTDELNAEAERVKLARPSPRSSRLRERAAPPPEPAEELEQSEVVGEGEEYPTMVSFSKPSIAHSRLAMSVGDSAWSHDMPLTPHVESSASLLDRTSGKRHEIAMHVVCAPGRFFRTRVVNFVHRLVLINDTGVELRAVQTGCEDQDECWVRLERNLKFGERANAGVPWIWSNGRKQNRIRLKVSDRESRIDWMPSMPFRLGGKRREDFIVKSRHPFDPDRLMPIHVSESVDEGVRFVMQKGGVRWEDLPPFFDATEEDPTTHGYPYSWDAPFGLLRLEVRGITQGDERSGKCATWKSSLKLGRNFAKREVRHRGVVISLVELVGQMRLLTIEPTESTRDASNHRITSVHIVPTAAEAGLVDTSSRMFRMRSKHASVLHAREFGAGVLERAGTVEDRLRGAADTVRAYFKSRLSRVYELAVKSRVRSSAHTRLLTEGRKLLSVLKDAEERDRDVQLKERSVALTGGSGSSDFFGAEAKDPLDLPVHIHVHVDFGTCGASLLNGTPEELLHVEIRRFAFQMTHAFPHIKFEASCGLVQVDNQLLTTALPVVLAPRNLKRNEPTLRLRMQLNRAMPSVDYIQAAQVDLAPLTLQLDFNLLWEVYKLVLETGLLDLLKPPDADEALHGPWWLRVSTPRLTTRSDRSLVIDELSVSHIDALVTTRSTILEKTDDEFVARTTANVPSPTRFASDLILTLFCHVDRMPLFVPSATLSVTRSLSSWPAFFDKEGMRFTYLVPYLAVSLLGSLNLLGGLVDVMRTTMVALWSTFVGPLFVRAPRVHGLTDEEQRNRHARAMLKEFANRLLRLVPMLTYVGCMSARRVASATSQLLTLSSLDTQYSKQHATRMESAQSIQTVVEGFSEGLAALVLALQDSITGVVYKPYIGYREGRARGAFWGATQGVLGLSKAFVGLADFAAKVAEGLSEMSRPFTLLAGTEPQRLQSPLACRWTRLVHEYNKDEAEAYSLLSRCAVDVSDSVSEFYHSHFNISQRPRWKKLRLMRDVERTVLITTKRVVFGCIATGRVYWSIRLERLVRVEFPAPYTKIIVWSWKEITALSSDFTGTVNIVLEHAIHGNDAEQLLLCFERLSGWARQQFTQELRENNLTAQHALGHADAPDAGEAADAAEYARDGGGASMRRRRRGTISRYGGRMADMILHRGHGNAHTQHQATASPRMTPRSPAPRPMSPFDMRGSVTATPGLSPLRRGF